jgi:hypothetical protein
VRDRREREREKRERETEERKREAGRKGGGAERERKRESFTCVKIESHVLKCMLIDKPGTSKPLQTSGHT